MTQNVDVPALDGELFTARFSGVQSLRILLVRLGLAASLTIGFLLIVRTSPVVTTPCGGVGEDSRMFQHTAGFTEGPLKCPTLIVRAAIHWGFG